jgi:hypothetical protein
LSHKKLSRQCSDGTKSDDDSIASVEAPVAAKKPVTISGKKRVMLLSSKPSEQPLAKRSALVWNSPDQTIDQQVEVAVDTSMLQAAPLTESEDSDDQRSASKIDEETEIQEQSMIVSEVACRLAQCVRKAMRGHRGTRSRRSGIVTPPFGSSCHFNSSSGNLLTYDDECRDEADLDETGPQFNLRIVPQTDDNAKRGDRKAEDSDFVISNSTAEDIIQRVFGSIAVEQRGSVAAAARVAGFCMVTSPSCETSLCNGIQELLSSCNGLAVEFHLYRSALHPSESTVHLHQIWEHEGSRCEAARDFRIFAINSIQRLLSEANLAGALPSKNDLATLERTANTWQSSVGVTV